MQVPYRKEVPMFNKLIYFVYETVNQDTEVFVVVKNINQSSICISFVQVACIFLFLAFQKAVWYRFCQTITSFCSLALVGLFVCLFVFFLYFVYIGDEANTQYYLYTQDKLYFGTEILISRQKRHLLYTGLAKNPSVQRLMYYSVSEPSVLLCELLSHTLLATLKDLCHVHVYQFFFLLSRRQAPSICTTT